MATVGALIGQHFAMRCGYERLRQEMFRSLSHRPIVAESPVEEQLAGLYAAALTCYSTTCFLLGGSSLTLFSVLALWFVPRDTRFTIGYTVIVILGVVALACAFDQFQQIILRDRNAQELERMRFARKLYTLFGCIGVGVTFVLAMMLGSSVIIMLPFGSVVVGVFCFLRLRQLKGSIHALLRQEFPELFQIPKAVEVEFEKDPTLRMRAVRMAMKYLNRSSLEEVVELYLHAHHSTFREFIQSIENGRFTPP